MWATNTEVTLLVAIQIWDKSTSTKAFSFFFWSAILLFHCFPQKMNLYKYICQTKPPKHTHLMSPKSFLFPAMATTMSSGPCSFNSFTHFFRVWKESWTTGTQQSQLDVEYVFLSSHYDQSDTQRTRKELRWWRQTHKFSDVVDDDGSSRPSVIHGS